MMHDKRDLDATYRVVRVSEGTYSVTKFSNNITDDVPETNTIQDSVYREDTLPTWMIEMIRTLDVSGEVSKSIPMYGQKLDNSYWFFSEEHNKLAFSMCVSPVTLFNIITEGMYK